MENWPQARESFLLPTVVSKEVWIPPVPSVVSCFPINIQNREEIAWSADKL